MRALEVVRQGDVHVEVGDRVLLAARAVLDAHRVKNVLDADAIDRDAARVGPPLNVVDDLPDLEARAIRTHRKIIPQRS